MSPERPIPDSYIKDPEQAREQAEAESPFRNVLDELEEEFYSRPGIGDDPRMSEVYTHGKLTLESFAKLRSDTKQVIQEMRPLLDRGNLKKEIARLRDELKSLDESLEARIDDILDNPEQHMDESSSSLEERLLDLHARIAVGVMLLRAERYVREIQAKGMLNDLLRVFPKTIRIRTLDLEDALCEVTAHPGTSMDDLHDKVSHIETLEEMLQIAEKIKAEQE